jgi:hypothetical protein
MKCAWLVRLAAVTWTVSAARPVSAQTTVLSPNPTEHSRLIFGALGGWDTNASFLTNEARPSWLSEVTVEIDHARSRPRVNWSFSGRGAASYFGQQKELNELSFGAWGAAIWKPSLHTTLSVAEDLTSGYTTEVSVLTRAGLVLPRSQVLASVSHATLETRFAPHTSLRSFVIYEAAAFRSHQLVGGSELRAEAGVRHDVSSQSRVGVEYALWQSWTRGTVGRAHSVNLDLERDVGPRAHTHLELGAAYNERSRGWAWLGSLAFSATGRRVTAGIRAAREMGQAFGLGRDRIADLVDLTLAWHLSRTVSATAFSGYGISRGQDDASRILLKSLDVTTGLTWTVSRTLSLLGNYGYERAVLGSVPTSARRGSITIRYAVDLR